MNPAQRSVRNGTVIEADINDLKRHITLRKGGDEQKGMVWNIQKKRFDQASLTHLKESLKQFELEFADFAQNQVNTGNQAPRYWPPHLLDKKLQLLYSIVSLFSIPSCFVIHSSNLMF